jgi:hypothetical protein
MEIRPEYRKKNNILMTTIKCILIFIYYFYCCQIKDLFKDYCSRNYLPLLKEYDNNTNIIHIVRAGRVTSWTPDLIEELQSISLKKPDKFKFHTMPNVGHWIHAEDQEGLLDLIAGHSTCFTAHLPSSL